MGGVHDFFFEQPNVNSSPFLNNFTGMTIGGTLGGQVFGRGDLTSYVKESQERHVHTIHLPGGHCSYQNFHVTKKEYEEASKQRLKGDISSSLLDLKHLKHLDLSCNNFGGNPIPRFIGSLENLRYLNLSCSNFGGTIPPQLGNLSDLQVLCLGSFHVGFESTRMMNIGWLSSLGMLNYLDMSGVDLSKATNWLQVINTHPSLIRLHLSMCELSNTEAYVPNLNLTSLSMLDLSYNNFSSSLPHWVFTITSLISLDLSGCNFHDPLPRSTHSFRNLTSLETLHVAKNGFMKSPAVLEELSSNNLLSLNIRECGISSSLLDSLHNLTSLHSIDLSINHLTKRIPKSLGNLCNLREIDLSENKLGNISLTDLLESFFDCKSPGLESLSLSWNHIVGIIPHSIERLSFLRKLDLQSNRISGPIPYSIARLSSLEELYLSNNDLNNSLPESIGQLSSLRMLDLSDNRIEGSLPKSLGQLSKLAACCKMDPSFPARILDFDILALGPRFPLWVQSQKDLIHLDISNTRISSPMPELFMRSFPNLYYLDISNNQIQGTLSFLVVPATIEQVDLSSNEFEGPLHHFLCSNGMKGTKVLNLGNNHLSGDIPECWEKWSSLILLNLENNNLYGKIPITLGSIPSLKLLNMRGNKISGRLPSSLMNLTALKILQLGRNDLAGSIPTWIGTKLTLLILLNLRGNNFDRIIPQELCYLMNVQILDLAHNKLSGNIPRCFNNFSILSGKNTNSIFQFVFELEYGLSIAEDSLVMKGREDAYINNLPLVMLLDLSSNNLVGHIPHELTSLVQLKFLNLSRNQLTGSIPEKIGDMEALESFDLSTNKLFGELPVSLRRLHFLSSFNVSYNNLTGRIPTSTQLQSFNESSFFGNKLCGAPLTETNGCVRVEVTTTTKGDKKEDNGRDWGLIISIVLGFFTGFWIIVGPLTANTSWGIAYFRMLTKWTKFVPR
ncbi:receptor-like protein EIX2 [Bidens hawaiensis]|uniref:receptor-like protein EIX2 n=1 Tax=Bidens hawaiensis TaxID=980011 RepID=UPI004049B461